MNKKPAGFGYPTVVEFTDRSILDYFDTKGPHVHLGSNAICNKGTLTIAISIYHTLNHNLESKRI